MILNHLRTSVWSALLQLLLPSQHEVGWTVRCWGDFALFSSGRQWPSRLEIKSLHWSSLHWHKMLCSWPQQTWNESLVFGTNFGWPTTKLDLTVSDKLKTFQCQPYSWDKCGSTYREMGCEPILKRKIHTNQHRTSFTVSVLWTYVHIVKCSNFKV